MTFCQCELTTVVHRTAIEARFRRRVGLKKYVMLVDVETGPLGRLVPRLQELEFRIVRVPEAAVAIEFVRAFPKLSMVAISDTGNHEQDIRLLREMRELQPGLPLLWHGPAGALPESENIQVLPHDRVTAGDLVACAERLLCQHFYPDEFAQFLADAALMAFSDFGAHATSTEPFLKASRARLAELSSVIAFSGRDISGDVVMSAPRGVVESAYLRLFGDPSAPGDDALCDVLGECCNRIIGKLVTYFEKRGMSMTFGVPLYLSGPGCVLSRGTHGPTLALDFETLNGHLFVELRVDGFDSKSTSTAAVPADLFEAGRFVLL